MSWRRSALGVALRLPGLFIIDYWWKHESTKSLPHSLDHMEIVNCILTNFVLLHGFLLLLLPLAQVQTLYRHLVSGALLVASHMVLEQGGGLAVVVLCCCLAAWLLHPAYLPPVVAWRLLGLPGSALATLAAYCLSHLPAALAGLKLSLSTRDPLSALWHKVFRPAHFALYWLLLFCAQLASRALGPAAVEEEASSWPLILLSAASAVCDSPVTLVATAVALSYLSFFCLSCTKMFLEGRLEAPIDNSMHVGWTEGITFVILSLQTSLMELKMPGRTAHLAIILFIVLSSLLQSMLEITEPVVLALSASHSRSVPAHLRAFSLALLLFALPLYLTYVLCHLFPIDFWIMMVFSGFVLTSFQDLDLFVVYLLFLYDRAGDWDGLDDAVYFARASHKVLEFAVAVFVVTVGLGEGNWTLPNAAVLAAHCYVNVWQRLQAGWQSYMLRREAVKKAAALQDACPQTLAKLNDVCSICYSPMETGCCSTPCLHHFHRTCLKKWLYIQDRCPLCHQSITPAEPCK